MKEAAMVSSVIQCMKPDVLPAIKPYQINFITCYKFIHNPFNVVLVFVKTKTRSNVYICKYSWKTI
jgi:hypothetical protein